MKPYRQEGARGILARAAVLVAFTASAWGCATAPPRSPVPCSRVGLEPAPPWTASAAWNAEEDELVLVDPGSRSLASYGLDGHRLREVPLDLAELASGEPMRFERAEDGYLLVGKTQVLHLDDDLAPRSRDRPFAPLASRGVIDGSFNDAVLHRGVFYGYADFVDAGDQPEDDPQAGTWRRGFVRLDPAGGELEMLHELPLADGADARDGEYASYYLYDRRPYVAPLGAGVYVLRFTEPWTVHRVTRRGLRQIAAGDGADDRRAHALQAWNGKLYVLTSRPAPEPETARAAEEHATPATPAGDPRARMELLQALPVATDRRRRWTLEEIDPRGGAGRRLALPSSAERIRLVPGRFFWTAIEETTSPNLGGEYERTAFLFLPSEEIVAGSFSCSGD